MNRPEAAKILTDLISTIEAVEAARTSLESLIGAGDGTLWSAVYRLVDISIDSFEKSVNDQFETVYWFIYENDCGKKELQHSLPNGSMTKVASISDLLDVFGVTNDCE
jgi:hypothetical protein